MCSYFVGAARAAAPGLVVSMSISCESADAVYLNSESGTLGSRFHLRSVTENAGMLDIVLVVMTYFSGRGWAPWRAT